MASAEVNNPALNSAVNSTKNGQTNNQTNNKKNNNQTNNQTRRNNTGNRTKSVQIRIPKLIPLTGEFKLATQTSNGAPQVAQSVISSFQEFLSKNPSVRETFITVYNNGDDKNYTMDNTRAIMEIAKQAYKTSNSGSNQGSSFNIQRFAVNLKMSYFHPSVLAMPPLKTTDVNAFYTFFLIMLLTFSDGTRGTYEKIVKRLSISNDNVRSDFDKFNKDYILNTNFLILYTIFMRKLYGELNKYKTIISKFVSNVQVVMDALKQEQTNRNRNGKLSNKKTIMDIMTYLNDYIGKDTTLVQKYLKLKNPNFSQLFYICYTVGTVISMIESYSKNVMKKISEFDEPIDETSVFYNIIVKNPNIFLTKFGSLIFINETYDKNRTNIVSFLTSATRLYDIIPREIFREINLKQITERNLTALGEVYATFWFRYANISRFLKDMVLRTSSITDLTRTPTVCAYYTKPLDYQLRISGDDPKKTFIFGYENDRRERQKIVNSFGQLGEAEIEPELYMGFNNDELYYVTEKLSYTGDLKSLFEIFRDDNLTGLRMLENETDKTVTAEVRTKVLADHSNTKSDKYFEHTRYNRNNNSNENNQQIGGEALETLLKKYTTVNKQSNIATVPLVFSPTIPSKSNNYKVYEGGIAGSPTIKIRRVYFDENRNNSTKLNKFKVNGWIVSVDNIDVAIAEYVPQKVTSNNKNPDLVFNITVFSLRNKPSLGILLVPTILLAYQIISKHFFETHQVLSSGRMTNLAKKRTEAIKTSIRGIKSKFTKSHEYTPEARVSVSKLIQNPILMPSTRISCL